MKTRIIFLIIIGFLLSITQSLAIKYEIPEEIKITVKGPQYKDFLKQYLILIQNNKNGLLNPKHIKQSVRSEISWKHADVIKKDLARIRLTGDNYYNHFNLKRNLASIFVKLENENIDGVTKFKLFLPSARQYLNEIFATLFLEKLGFLTPKTKIIKVEFNEKKYFAIFQEHPSKELIERNNLKDGVIIEGNEDHYYFNSYFYRKTNPMCCYSKIDNFSFLKNNNLNKKILFNASTKFTSQVYNEPIQSKIHYNFLDFKNNDYIIFDKIMKFLSAEHGISINNRKFYYDALYNKLIPIYYDGEVSLDFKFEFDDFLKNKKINSLILNKNFKKDFIEDLNSRIHPQYLEVDKPRTELFFKKINLLFDELNTRAIKYKLEGSLEENEFKKINKPVLSDILAKDAFQDLNLVNFSKNKFEICKVRNLISLSMKCKILKDEEANKILRNNRKYMHKKKTFPQVVGFINGLQKQDQIDILRTKKFNDHNDIFKKKKIVLKQVFNNRLNFIEPSINDINIKKNNTYVIYSEDKNKDININFNYLIKDNTRNENLPRIVFIGSFDKIEIKVNADIVNLNKVNNETVNRYNDRQLTGCINFIDANFKNFNGEISNMPCEDAINFVRSYGNINSLKITNSKFDALDLDFSKISANKIEINNAGNDCLDFSSGEYKIKNFKLISCGDKGISAGEKSILKINSGYINNAAMGLASKDLSRVIVKNYIDINKSKKCFDTYQKKQEFGDGIIEIKSEGSIKCNN